MKVFALIVFLVCSSAFADPVEDAINSLHETEKKSYDVQLVHLYLSGVILGVLFYIAYRQE